MKARDEGSKASARHRSPDAHERFVRHPHRTLLGLAIPVLGSMVAEPLTGLVDTAFVSNRGPEALAALGVGTMALSSIFWIFNFLGVGTQTQVARAWGGGKVHEAREIHATAQKLGFLIGSALLGLGWLLAPVISRVLGADDLIAEQAVIYMRIRLAGGPALLVMIASFGALRGLQDMRSPLWIAVGSNLLNVLLDALLIDGVGPVPALGVAGAAWASVASHWMAATWAAKCAWRRLGRPASWNLRGAARLIRLGGDLFARTGLLTLFLLLATRVATQAGAESGAAHQAIRQVWFTTALLLDAFAVAAQSMVAFFVGANQIPLARHVARLSVLWSLGLGVLLTLAMGFGTDLALRLLVPTEAWSVFHAAWFAALLLMPINALSFATDGVHWGTGDFAYLRNAMAVSTGLGAVGLMWIDTTHAQALAHIWWITGIWITSRASLGLTRIWPGLGRAPLRL